jgi:hypothetical protein
MTTEELLKEIPENILNSAIEEIENLRRIATPEQKENLLNQLHRLDLSHAEHCYYGLMTGDCFSPQAAELINQVSPLFTGNLPLDPRDVQTRHAIDLTEPGDINDRNYTCLEATGWWLQNRIPREAKQESILEQIAKYITEESDINPLI